MINQLQIRIKYNFTNIKLLEEAISHRSCIRLETNNERLEFLGDAVLNMVIADWLYSQFPQATEGVLSRIRSNMVNRTNLAKLAVRLKLGEVMKLGAGELSSGGRQRQSILADASEALIGAIYLDSDYNTCRDAIIQWFKEDLPQKIDDADIKDSKSILQELLQSKHNQLPTYSIIKTTGQAHQRQFTVKCQVTCLKLTRTGTASSKRGAEQIAASKILEAINHAPEK